MARFKKKVLLRLAIIILISFLGFNGLALKPDTLYVVPFKQRFSVRIYTGVRELSFIIANGNKSGTNEKISYKPNNGVVSGIGFSVNNLLINFTTKLPGTEQDINRFGKTDIVDYQLNLTLRYLHVSLFQRNYSGFFIANSSAVNPDFTNLNSKIIRPDINYQTNGFETIYSLNPRRYSLNASFKMTEKQVKNVWAGLIYANYSSINISGDSTLIPFSIKSSFNDQDFLYKGSYLGGAIQPGVTYSFTKGNFFVNPMFFAGIGYVQQKIFVVGDGINKYNNIYFRLSTRVSSGYNGRWFFGGFVLDWNNSYLPARSLTIKTGILSVMFLGGFRF